MKNASKIRSSTLDKYDKTKTSKHRVDVYIV